MQPNIEDTVCKLMSELGNGNLSAIQSTLKGIDPGIVKYSLSRFTEQGKIEFGQGKYLDAINSFSQAISGYKLDLKEEDKVELSKLLSNRSLCYLKLGQEENYNKAFQDAKECVLLNPGWSKGWYRAGKALYHLKVFDKAVIVFKAALKREGHQGNNDQSIKEIEGLIRVCEKKAEHDAAIRRVTVDYSRFEDALKELEIEELAECANGNTGQEDSSASQNIINLPSNFAGMLPGGGDLSSSVGNFEGLQLELSPDLSQEEIENLKLSLGGSASMDERSSSDKKRRAASKFGNQLVFNHSMKFVKSDPEDSKNDNIKGISRLLQISSEIQWFKRIIEHFVDRYYLYADQWLSILDQLGAASTLFIGSGSFALPVHYYKKFGETGNIVAITQAKSNSPIIYRLYANMAMSNRVKVSHFNPFHSEFIKDFGKSVQREREGSEETSSHSDDSGSLKIIHGNVQSLKLEFWELFSPASVIIDPSVFEPGVLGYGLVKNLKSIRLNNHGLQDEQQAGVSVTPTLVRVYLHFSDVSIPPLDLENQGTFEVSMDRLNEGLWSPYWEPFKVGNAYPHIKYMSKPFLLGYLPLEEMVNKNGMKDYFCLNLDSSGEAVISKLESLEEKKAGDIIKGVIDYYLEPNTQINSVILTFKAVKELGSEEILLLDSSREMDGVGMESVIPPAISWIGCKVSNKDQASPARVRFDLLIEETRIVVAPNAESLSELNKRKLPSRFTVSLPRSVIENLWDTQSVGIWWNALVDYYKSSIVHNTAGKVFEGLITSTSPGAILPIALLYVSSKMNKSTQNNLYSNWRKTDFHFTCIENLPNVQDLYMRIIKDNIHIILSDVVENEIKKLFNHDMSSNGGLEANKSKYWKPMNEISGKGEDLEEKERQEKSRYHRWISSNSSAKHILNKKLSERITFLNCDVRQILPKTAKVGSPSQSGGGVQYYFVDEKVRLFAGMNFDHDGFSEGIVPLWGTAFSNGLVRRHSSNKIPNIPVPSRISFYGFVARVGPNSGDENGIDISCWDTYRFEGNSQWVPIKTESKYSLSEMSKVFHILTLDLNPENFPRLPDRKEVCCKITRQGRVNSVVVFFDLWIDGENVLTTSPLRSDSFERVGSYGYAEESSPATSSSSTNKVSEETPREELRHELNRKASNCHKTTFWKPVFHMIPQQMLQLNDSIELEFRVEESFTKLKFKINAINSSNGESTPSTVTSEDAENSPSILPPLGDVAYLQLRERYDSIVKEISPTIYSNNSAISVQAFNASLSIALNPSFYQGEHEILAGDIPYEIDSLNWLCQSFLL